MDGRVCCTTELVCLESIPRLVSRVVFVVAMMRGRVAWRLVTSSQ